MSPTREPRDGRAWALLALLSPLCACHGPLDSRAVPDRFVSPRVQEGQPPPTREAPEGGDKEAPTNGLFSIKFDNDYFTQKDSNYTAGGSLQWVTPEIETLSSSNVFRQLTDALSFLPTVGDPEYRKYVSVALGLELYTPIDQNSNPPPPDEQPYASVLALDTAVYTQSDKSLHAYGLRLGLVGPSTRGGGLQRSIHRWQGKTPPAGWEHQLDDEFLVNLLYQYQYRAVRVAEPQGWGFDLTGNAAGGLGNYYTGVSVGAALRIGYQLPENYSVAIVPAGREALVGLVPTQRGVSGFLSFNLQGLATARFLPMDGNTFEDSPSVDRDPFTANLSIGLYLSYKRWLLSASVHNWQDIFSLERNEGRDYGSIRISYMF